MVSLLWKYKAENETHPSLKFMSWIWQVWAAMQGFVAKCIDYGQWSNVDLSQGLDIKMSCRLCQTAAVDRSGWSGLLWSAWRCQLLSWSTSRYVIFFRYKRNWATMSNFLRAPTISERSILVAMLSDQPAVVEDFWGLDWDKQHSQQDRRDRSSRRWN